jgi:hypothetical protein
MEIEAIQSLAGTAGWRVGYRRAVDELRVFSEAVSASCSVESLVKIRHQAIVPVGCLVALQEKS